MLASTHRGEWGDPTSSTKNSTDGPVPVDLSKFDVTATVGIIPGAPQTVRMVPSDVKTMYLIVEPATDPATRCAFTVAVRLHRLWRRYIVFAGDGTVNQVNLPT